MWNRYLGQTLAVLLATAASFALPARAAPSNDVPCSVSQATHISAELVCGVDAAPSSRDLLFSVNFQGVHDDSLAELASKMDGQPLACGDGSRPRLQGENEGHSLSCSFRIPGDGLRRELRFRIDWSHAEPTGYALKAAAIEQP